MRQRGPRCPPIFWSLKKRTKTFNFHSNESSRDILEQLGRYDHPWGKKKQQIVKRKFSDTLNLMV